MHHPFLDRLRGVYIRVLAILRIPGHSFQIADEWETLRTIQRNRASMARFGDGELLLMLGHGIYFQEYDPELADRLRSIVRQPSSDFLIGLPPFDTMAISKPAWIRRWQRYRRLFSHFVSGGGGYHSAAVSRPDMVRDLDPIEFYDAMMNLWRNRSVIVVHNKKIASDHPMLQPATSVQHLFCDAEHAYRGYPRLLAEATRLHREDPDAIFLIAAGPTACILAWDLAQLGAQALDVGHMASGYDKCVAASTLN